MSRTVPRLVPSLDARVARRRRSRESYPSSPSWEGEKERKQKTPRWTRGVVYGLSGRPPHHPHHHCPLHDDDYHHEVPWAFPAPPIPMAHHHYSSFASPVRVRWV